MNEYLKLWWKFLDRHFNMAELQGLCFGLDVDHENIGASGKSAFAFELVRYLSRRDMIPHELSQEIVSQRPKLAKKLPKMPPKEEQKPRNKVNGKQVQFEQAIAHNEIDLAISIFGECLTKLSLPTQKLIKLRGRWNGLKMENVDGTLDHETSSIEMNKIRKSLLDLWAMYFKTNH